MLDELLAAASLPFAAAGTYLGTLALVARRPMAPAGSDVFHFDVIVPAHDEEDGIGVTVANLLALDYPRDRYRLIVVADNCTDATAARARAAGARVLERDDPARRGKGYALAHAYAASLADGFADAIVSVDADSSASPNLLSAIAARLAAGAQCVQTEHGVRNVATSWRTRLMTIAYALHHTLRSWARERLGLSCGLRGNGMAFTTELLRRFPFRAFSPVEDLEYGLVLGMNGIRVVYADEAAVLADMPESDTGARAQRDRWQHGRRALRRRYVTPLLRACLRRQDRVPLELAMDLLVPPLALLACVIAAGLAVAVGLRVLGEAGRLAITGWGLAATGLLIYVARGWSLAGLGGRGVLDLLWVPVFVLWKGVVLLTPSRASRGEWVRTRRAIQS
jgi:cellulose synthase/poly-beta-1,6-N-acetylglucosamine synthase-like glycosyltransferase